jgi:hypothetical protein
MTCRRIVLLAVFLAAGASPAGASCPGSTCSVPGGGNPTTDCQAEFDGPVLNYPPGRNVAASCVDGDPACDADGAADGTCHFSVSVCFLNADDRLPDCVPGAIYGYEIKNRPPGRRGFNQELFDLNLAVLLGVPTTMPSCSAPRPISVPLRGRSGAFRKGSLRIRAESFDGLVTDRDRLSLICLP